MFFVIELASIFLTFKWRRYTLYILTYQIGKQNVIGYYISNAINIHV